MIRVIGASVCGTSHERIGQVCQDFHAYHLLTDSLLLIAVADGAGSARCAEVGALTAVQSVVDYLIGYAVSLPTWEQGEAWASLWREAFGVALCALEREAEASGTDLRDFATTLIVAVVGRDGVSAAQIGDGAIVVRDATGDLHTLTAPQTGEYQNETRFLTALTEGEPIDTPLYCGSVTHVAAFSDGLQHLALRQQECVPHPPFFTPLFQFATHIEDEDSAHAQLEQFLTSPRLRERTDDDLTLVLAALRA